MTTLAIPDAVHTPIPTGWLEQVLAPAVAESSWEELDDAEGRIKAVAAYLDAHGTDALELEKAMRVVESRRGVIAGVDVLPGERTDLNTRVKVPDSESPMSISRYRKLARNWDWLWPERVLPATNRGNVTQARCLKYIDERIGEVDEDEELPFDWHQGDAHLLFGDYRERLKALPDKSVDLILTDPPYPKDSLPLWSDLAHMAKWKLKPTGYLLAMSGKIHLDEVMIRLGEHLNYGWMFNWQMEGAATRILGRNIRQTWKPVLAYTVDTWSKRDSMPDTIPTGAQEKGLSGWQQQVAPAQWMIERFTPENGLVLDPYLGVGSFGVAAIKSGRRFMGVELDPDRYEDAKQRLHD
jgi:DNA methylase